MFRCSVYVPWTSVRILDDKLHQRPPTRRARLASSTPRLQLPRAPRPIHSPTGRVRSPTLLTPHPLLKRHWKSAFSGPRLTGKTMTDVCVYVSRNKFWTTNGRPLTVVQWMSDVSTCRYHRTNFGCNMKFRLRSFDGRPCLDD